MFKVIYQIKKEEAITKLIFRSLTFVVRLLFILNLKNHIHFDVLAILILFYVYCLFLGLI